MTGTVSYLTMKFITLSLLASLAIAQPLKTTGATGATGTTQQIPGASEIQGQLSQMGGALPGMTSQQFPGMGQQMFPGMPGMTQFPTMTGFPTNSFGSNFPGQMSPSYPMTGSMGQFPGMGGQMGQGFKK